MRLPVIFIAFFLGLLSGSPLAASRSAWPDLFFIAASVIALIIFRRSSKLLLVSIFIVAFLLGNFWISHIPSRPDPLVLINPPVDSGCTITGRAAGETFETREGRFLPLSIEKIRAEGFTLDGSAVQENWTFESGLVLAKIRRDFIAVPGSHYRVHGKLIHDPERFYAPILLRYRIRAIIEPLDGKAIITRIGDPSSSSNASNRFRHLLISHLSWGLGKPEDELVAGITLGRKGRRLGGNWTKDFYQSGLSHLIVASGAQVSLLFMPVFFLLGRIRLPVIAKWILLIFLGATLIGFARLLGGEPSILRSAVMGCVLLLSIGFGRRTFGLATLSAAGLYWLLINPLLMRDVGFLLSFGASFGIIYLGPPLFDVFSIRIPLQKPGLSLIKPFKTLKEISVYSFRLLIRLLTDLTLVTLSAQIGVLPVLACTIGRISLAGFIANLFAVPIAQIILYLGGLSGLGGFVSPVISIFLNGILKYLAIALMSVAHDFADIPYANVPIQPLPGWFAFAWYGLCILAVERCNIHRQHRIARMNKAGKNINAGDGQAAEIDLDNPLPPEFK